MAQVASFAADLSRLTSRFEACFIPLLADFLVVIGQNSAGDLENFEVRRDPVPLSVLVISELGLVQGALAFSNFFVGQNLDGGVLNKRLLACVLALTTFLKHILQLLAARMLVTFAFRVPFFDSVHVLLGVLVD